MVALIAIAPVVLLTLLIGLRGVAAMRTTSDFLVASRRVSPLLNSAAVSGEYLSAASFLGIAGLIVQSGIGALWYAVGFTAGYIAMLTLVAAPMRRSGALTVPDFAEARLGSVRLRRLTAVVVLVIGTLYIVAQFRTAGLVLSVVGDTPYWTGVVVTAMAVSIALALGGMRAATYVQAFQFGLKLLLIAVPAVWLIIHLGGQTREQAFQPVEFTHFEERTAVTFEVPVTMRIDEPTAVRADDGRVRILPEGRVTTDPGERWVFPSGAAVPTVQGTERPGGETWAQPLLDVQASGNPLLGTWSVLAATLFGTMGLPHILMRFHTSPDGRAARRTAAITVALLSLFYVFPGIYGVLGRVLTPELYLSGAADTAVVALPAQVDTGWAGTLFTGLLTAGAFSAFLATSLGLLLVLAGAVAHDFVRTRLRTLRLTGPVVAVMLALLALGTVGVAADILVTWAFTVAAATFCPLLVLGIWWSGLTVRGAAAGVITGLSMTSGSILFGLSDPSLPGWAGTLVIQPALWTVPLSFATMVAVSKSGRAPLWGANAVLRLHLDGGRTRQHGPPEESPAEPTGGRSTLRSHGGRGQD